MFFSRLHLRPEGLHDRDVRRHLFDGYGAHRLVWSFFDNGSDTKRDFLYRIDEAKRLPVFYVVSHREPSSVGSAFRAQVKPFAPQLDPGDRLRFQLRANPVVSRNSPGSTRSRRHDVVMDLKKRDREGGGKKLQSELVHEAAMNWIASRAVRCGFEIEASRLRADGYQQHRFLRRLGGKLVQFSTVDFEGVLTVRDEDRFRDTLFTGLGPAKGFGCGLLLVRRN